MMLKKAEAIYKRAQKGDVASATEIQLNTQQPKASKKTKEKLVIAEREKH